MLMYSCGKSSFFDLLLFSINENLAVVVVDVVVSPSSRRVSRRILLLKPEVWLRLAPVSPVNRSRVGVHSCRAIRGALSTLYWFTLVYFESLAVEDINITHVQIDITLIHILFRFRFVSNPAEFVLMRILRRVSHRLRECLSIRFIFKESLDKLPFSTPLHVIILIVCRHINHYTFPLKSNVS